MKLLVITSLLIVIISGCTFSSKPKEPPEKGHTILPIFMYIGVRIGGHGWLPTPFRWGFGRPWPEGYYSKPEKAEK